MLIHLPGHVADTQNVILGFQSVQLGSFEPPFQSISHALITVKGSSEEKPVDCEQARAKTGCMVSERPA